MMRFLPILLVLILVGCAAEDEAVRLPEPGGPHAVGSRYWLLTDSTRAETFTEDPHDLRQVALRAWYPAAAPAGEPLPYLRNPEARKAALPPGSPLPPEFFDRAGAWLTNSYEGVEPAELRCPVILFSHALGAGMNQSTILMEELASRGYFVISVGHAFETSHFDRPDGSILVFPPDIARGRETRAALPVQAAIAQAVEDAELDSLIRELNRLRPLTLESLKTWTADLSFALDQVERWSREGPFAGRLDLDRVGALGHSFGGAAAGQLCLDDARCKAGVNLDGLQLGDMIDRPLERPFLFVHHDNPGAAAPEINRLFVRRAGAPAWLVTVEGTRHLSFCDFSWPEFSRALPFPEGSLGPIDGMRCQEIQNALILAFFDAQLRGHGSPTLEDLAERWPELHFLP